MSPFYTESLDDERILWSVGWIRLFSPGNWFEVKTGLDVTDTLNKTMCTVTPEPTANSTILTNELSVSNAAVHPITIHNILRVKIFALVDIALLSR